ncbi:unnamed protein product, partial [marine sediment metagenome]
MMYEYECDDEHKTEIIMNKPRPTPSIQCKCGKEA